MAFLKFLLLIILIPFLLVLAFDFKACSMPESSFDLSSESRLPNWFEIPDGYIRENLTVEIYYYVSPKNKPDLKAILKDKKNDKKLKIKYGYTENITEIKTDNYPHFVKGIIDEKTEIIEHKKMEPVFYISDKKFD